MKQARMMHELFDEMYPQYGGKFCQQSSVMTHAAESLIDDFKELGQILI